MRKSSKVSKPMLRTESVHSNSITTMSVVTSATKTKENTDQQHFTEWYVIIRYQIIIIVTFLYFYRFAYGNYRYEFVKQTIVYINVESITVLYPDKCLYMDNETSTLRSLIDSETSASMTFYG